LTFGFSSDNIHIGMLQKVKVPVSVILEYNSKLRRVFPKSVHWDGNDYPVTKVGFHHTFREGKTLIHVFSVDTPSLFFRLRLNTDNLQWTLEEISDGEVD